MDNCQLLNGIRIFKMSMLQLGSIMLDTLGGVHWFWVPISDLMIKCLM